MNKKQREEVFEGNEIIKDFLLKKKLDTVTTSIEAIHQRLESINHKLSRVEDFIDNHSIQKIYDLESRIDDLERFETRLRESL